MAIIKPMEENAVFGMLVRGMNMQQIRRETGLSNKVVSKIAKKYALRIPYSKTKITPEIVSKIMELEKTGKPHREISAELMIGTSTCNRIIKEQKAKENVEQRADAMCEAPEGGEEVQLTIDPPDSPDGGQDPEELRDPFEMIQNALKEINGAIELLKEKYYD